LSTTAPCNCLSLAGIVAPAHGFFYTPESSEDKEMHGECHTHALYQKQCCVS